MPADSSFCLSLWVGTTPILEQNRWWWCGIPQEHVDVQAGHSVFLSLWVLGPLQNLQGLVASADLVCILSWARR